MQIPETGPSTPGPWLCFPVWDGGAEAQSCAKLSALCPTVSACGSPEDASGFTDGRGAPFCISERSRCQSLLQNCVCVCVFQNMCLRESCGALWYG